MEKLDKCDVDVWDPKNVLGRRGYQRQADENRIKGIAKFFEKHDAILPVAGLLNVRQKGKIAYKNGKLTIPGYVKLWVVDMQHRLRGLLEAYEHGVLSSGEFEVPVVITEGLSDLQEAAQFYVINTKAKKMDVALTRRLLIENDVVSEIADVKAWELMAVQATIDLNSKLKNPWKGAIRPPNTARQEGHIATEKSFVSSLKPHFLVGKSKQPKKTARRLASLWSAIEHNIEEAFDEPKKHLIQRTPGLFAFNFFLGPVLLSEYDDNEFKSKLKGLNALGHEFWRRSNKTGAHRFGTGMGAYADLAEFVGTKIGIH